MWGYSDWPFHMHGKQQMSCISINSWDLGQFHLQYVCLPLRFFSFGDPSIYKYSVYARARCTFDVSLKWVKSKILLTAEVYEIQFSCASVSWIWWIGSESSITSSVERFAFLLYRKMFILIGTDCWNPIHSWWTRNIWHWKWTSCHE